MFINMSHCVNKSNIDKAESQRGKLPMEIRPRKKCGAMCGNGRKVTKSVQMKIQYLENN